MNRALTAEALFREVFLPHYPEDARSDLGRARTTDANPANNPSILAHLDDAARTFAAMTSAALGVPDAEGPPRAMDHGAFLSAPVTGAGSG